jgi:hypothetical protein
VCHLSVLTMDGPFLLQDFDKSALLRLSKVLTFMNLSLDPTNVDPRHSDPMVFFSLPLELTLPRNLEEFLSVKGLDL